VQFTRGVWNIGCRACWKMYLQHNGAAPHIGRRSIRISTLLVSGLALGVPQNWLPRSPDLSLPEFREWWCMKDPVYERKVRQRHGREYNLHVFYGIRVVTLLD
jgi:hypothetical protein